MNLSDEQKAAIVDHLSGTSGVYDAATCEEYSLEMSELEQIMEDGEWLRCEQCGWWVETCETNDNGNCEECAGEAIE